MPGKSSSCSLIDSLETLGVTQLDDGWVKRVHDQDFTEFDPLPEDVQEELASKDYHNFVLQDILADLQTWIAGAQQGLWMKLIESNIPYKNILAFLAYLIEYAHKRLSTGVQVQAGVHAASVYLAFISIPGSRAFSIFHPVLFQRCIELFKLFIRIGGSYEKGKKKRKRSSSPKKSTQGRRVKARAADRTSNSMDGGDGEDAEEEDGGELLSHEEKQEIRSALIGLIKAVVILLRSYNMKESESLCEQAIQSLVGLTKLEPENVGSKLDVNVNISRICSVSQLAFMALGLMCSGNHGSSKKGAIRLVFKHLLPGALMLIGDSHGTATQSIPHDIQVIKDTTVNFVCDITDQHPEEAKQMVRVLLQHMCVGVPDKADYRSLIASALVKIMKKLNTVEYARMIEWICTLSRHDKVGRRAFCLDAIHALMMQPLREADSSVPENVAVFLTKGKLIEIILSRCSDVAASVRGKALSLVNQCSSCADPCLVGAFRTIMTPAVMLRPPMTRIIPTPDRNRTEPVTVDETPEAVRDKNKTDDTPMETEQESASTTPDGDKVESGVTAEQEKAADFVKQGTALMAANGLNNEGTPVSVLVTPGLIISLEESKGFVSMLRMRAHDKKVNVRKAAIQAIESMVILEGDYISKENLEVLETRCRDVGLTVRKQAVQSITNLLLQRPLNKDIQRTWLSSILPRIKDNETSVQEKCLDAVESVLFQTIMPYRKTQQSDNDQHRMVWGLLKILTEVTRADDRYFLQKCCEDMARAKKLKPALITTLKTHINTENNRAAWMLLAETARHIPKFDHLFVLDYWEEKKDSSAAEDCISISYVLAVFSDIASDLTPQSRGLVKSDLRSHLGKFWWPLDLIKAAVYCLTKFGIAESTKENSWDTDWCVDLLKACDNYLSRAILQEHEGPLNETAMIKYLYTLGVVAQMCPTKVPKRIYLLAESVIAAPVITSTDGSSQQPQLTQNVYPTEGTQGTQADDVLSQFRGSIMPRRVRAHGFITLGKLCLQHDHLAKRCIPALARELEVSKDVTTRNNVVLVLGDLCIRYTTLVDRYMPSITACLKDESPLVRKQTLTMMINLLQDDYLKLKGCLFYHFISTIIDDVKEIKVFAEYCLLHVLHKRNPDLFFHHLVECIFHFNAYEKHNVYNRFPQTERQKTLFSLKGKAKMESRMKIYKFMLEHMNDPQRFELTAKLAKEILGGIVDKLITLDSETADLLKDTLSVLLSKEIKLSTLRTRPDDDAIENEQEAAAAVVKKAKHKLITQVVKKNVIENIIPIIISLKQMLEKKRSPLLRELMTYLRELTSDYKNEVKDIFAADPQLAKEIEFDLQRFEAEREKQQLEAASAPGSAQLTPAGSPRASPPASAAASPRSGKGSAPATPGRGTAPASPRLNVPSLKPGTRQKEVPMATLALINLVRKNMEAPKGSSPGGSAPTTPQPGNVQLQPPLPAAPATPAQPINPNRAISTPSGAVGNLTFAGNLSIIPPSPISPTQRHILEDHGRGSTSVLSARPLENEEPQPPKDLLILKSPENPGPKPRVWNIKSPIPKIRLEQGDDDVGSSQDAEDETENAAGKTRVAQNKNNDGTKTRENHGGGDEEAGQLTENRDPVRKTGRTTRARGPVFAEKRRLPQAESNNMDNELTKGYNETRETSRRRSLRSSGRVLGQSSLDDSASTVMDILEPVVKKGQRTKTTGAKRKNRK